MLAPLRRLHDRVREVVVEACERSALAELARVDDDESDGDTIYAVDRVSGMLLELFVHEVAPIAPLVLVGEGLPDGQVILPHEYAKATRYGV